MTEGQRQTLHQLLDEMIDEGMPYMYSGIRLADLFFKK